MKTTLAPRSYAAQGLTLPPRRIEPVKAASPMSTLLNESMLRIVRPQAVGRWMMPQLAQITPTYVEQILRGAMFGSTMQQWELFDLMEDTWPRLLKNVGEIKDDAVDYHWQLEAFAEEDTPPSATALAKKKLVSEAIARMRPRPGWDENGFNGTLFDIADAWYKGLSVLEIDWGFDHGLHFPRATWWVDPHNYGWSDEGWVGLVTGDRIFPSTYSQQRSVEPFTEGKFLIALCKARSGSPMNTALLRALAWWWCAANFSGDWLMNLAQLFGIPFRWATYDQNAQADTIAGIGNMLTNMGSAGWGAFPEGTNINFLEAGKNAGASPQDGLLDRADTYCDLLILRQTLTSETGPTGGGSLALGKVHEGGREKEVKGVAGFGASVLNEQLIPMILELNYGNTDEAPKFCPEPEEREDEKANADRDKVLIDAGVKFPTKWFYQRHKIPLPAAGEETIERSATVPAGQPQPNDPNAEPETRNAELNARRATTKPTLPDFSKAFAALANDLTPAREELERILAIEDPDLMRMKLASFSHRIERLKHDITASSDFARELERLNALALAQGLEGERS